MQSTLGKMEFKHLKQFFYVLLKSFNYYSIIYDDLRCFEEINKLTSLIFSENLDDWYLLWQVSFQVVYKHAVAVWVTFVGILMVPSSCAQDDVTVSQIIMELCPSDGQVPVDEPNTLCKSTLINIFDF